MTTRPSGIRQLLDRLGPWRRRVVGLLLTWLGLVLAAVVLGLRPSVPHAAAILLAGAMLLWFLMDHGAAAHLTVWPLADGGELGAARGDDFRVIHLAARLEAANTRGEGRESVVRDLHLSSDDHRPAPRCPARHRPEDGAQVGQGRHAPRAVGLARRPPDPRPLPSRSAWTRSSDESSSGDHGPR